MSNYTQIIGSAQHDLNDINSILITLRENGKHGVIPAMYKEYDPTISSQPDSTVDRRHAIGISPIAAASACFLGKVPSNRSEVDAITLYLQILELIKNQEELNTGAKRFLDKCTTGISKQSQSSWVLHIRVHQWVGKHVGVHQELPRTSSNPSRRSIHGINAT